VTYKPNESVALNSSTFIGSDKPDSARQMRYFHNFYGIFQVAERLGITLGLDYGIEEKTPDTHTFNTWWSPVIIARYGVTNKIFLAARAEYYEDKHGVIIATETPNGFRTVGWSANFDYQIVPNAVWRIEVRSLTSKDAIFQKAEGFSKNNTFVTTSLAVSF
jgi:hypothetical protein